MKNPVIFVFLGKVKLTGEKILRQAKRLFSAGEIFTIEGEARETIAKIQANEGGLRLNRVNIYVIAAAEETDALSLVETAGENLRGKFCENFAAVDITLTVLLDESNDCDATETRNANTYKFLQGLTANDYNRIFLLSNKNEYGEILSEAKKKSLVVAAALPLLNTTQSQFNEALAAKAAARKQPLFASAGFWQQPPPRLDENFALHRLADELERNFFNLSSRGGETFKGKLPAVGGNGSSSRRHTPGYEKVSPPRTPPLQKDFNIIEDIAGVAAMPLRFWEVWGRTVKEAEGLLFGKEAERFYNRMYGREGFDESESAGETGTGGGGKLPLTQAVAEETRLRELISETETTLRELAHRITQAENSICRPAFSVDNVKTQIGEIYALRYEYETRSAELERHKNEHTRLQSYLDYIRGVARELKALPLAAPHEDAAPAPHAPIQIALFRSDDILCESHTLQTTNGDPCLLRVIGGFSLQDF